MRDTIAIIPARKNSKRLKNKNILNFLGKPLFYYSIINALKSKYISEVIVSTDSKKIKKISESFGARVPYLRDEKLSSDNSKTIDVVHDLYKNFISKKKNIKKIIILQPTSPLRDFRDINKSLEFFDKKKADYVTSLCSAKPKEWFFEIDAKNKIELKFFNEKKKNAKNNYLLNGAIYIYKLNLFKKKIFSINKSFGFVMDYKKFIDIDTYFDFKLAKFIMKHNQIK